MTSYLSTKRGRVKPFHRPAESHRPGREPPAGQRATGRAEPHRPGRDPPTSRGPLTGEKQTEEKLTESFRQTPSLNPSPKLPQVAGRFCWGALRSLRVLGRKIFLGGGVFFGFRGGGIF